MRNGALKICVFAGCMLVFCCGTEAQNVQIHYDTGSALYREYEDRPLITTTVEMFRTDRWGSTFFFVDMDYRSAGIAAAYWEIARELKFWQGNVSMHVEYNGGTPYVKNAFLLGTTYARNNADFTQGFAFTPMYKFIQTLHSPHQFQLTGTWYMYFAARKFSFTGFADWWREPGGDFGDFVLLAEPQGWMHLNRFRGVDGLFNLSIGSELEVSYDFAGRDGLFLIPTLALRWDF
ncbi:MAG: DUF5020 family protein [Tannerella sp.]|jgi:hypothetical protein|nr:DUF5020 family protein [Tannerella sp.]